MITLKRILGVSLVALAGLAGWRTYLHFFDTTMPHVQINGIEENRWYAGDMNCTVSCSKPGNVSAWIDDKPLINQFSIGGAGHDHPFSIPTRTIANGQHSLRLELTDSTFQRNKSTLERTFFVDNTPLQAYLLVPEGEHRVLQGRTLHIQFQVNKDIEQATVEALSNNYDCYAETKNSRVYEAFVPIACEERPSEYLYNVSITDHVGNKLALENKFQVVPFPFKKQTLAISDEKVKTEEEVGRDSLELSEALEKLTAASPKEKLWRGEFCTPIDVQRVTCDYGTIRTTQHKGRYAHKALDLINTPKSVVWSTQDGIVALKDRFAGSGNTVVVDHGCGILSLFFHLEDFAKIEVGQKIAKGAPLGKLGKTGYATGYHLHWEMRIGNIPVDPMQWTRSSLL